MDNSPINDDQTTPGFLVFDVPYLCSPPAFPGLVGRSPTRILLPILAVRFPGGAVVIPDEVLSWSRHLAERGTRSFDIRRRLNSIGRLHEFGQTVAADQVEQPGAMDLIVWEYLRSRVETPVDPGLRQFQHWQPVQYDVVRTEFRDLVDFSRYCANYSGPTSLMGSAFKTSAAIWAKVDRALPADRLLVHLEAQRARWHARFGGDSPTPPSKLKRLTATLGRKKSSLDTTLSIKAINAIIDRESNLIFKALWIELAYAGPRLSEALNQWRCDVLDASFSKRLFNSEVEGPLLIFAHPAHSLYTGSFGETVRTRKEVLKDRYGLVPRPDAASRKQRAGWKGMSVFNPYLQITHGTWTCSNRAAEFSELVADILDIHASLRTDAVHPYLYINSKNAAFLGDPLKVGNVEEAFDRACARAGVTPHGPGAHLHGLRHFYRWYARSELGLSEEIVQLMMRQKSITSQREYGRRSQDIHDAMDRLNSREKEL